MNTKSSDAATGVSDMHHLIIDLALDSLLSEYEGMGAVVMRPGTDGRLTVTASRMPHGWTDFWAVATAVRNLFLSGSQADQIKVEGRWLAIQSVSDSCGPIAAAVILDKPLPERRFVAVSRLIRSVLVSGDSGAPNPIPEGSVTVDVTARGGGYDAEVRRAGYRNNQPVRTRGETIPEAVALAATRLCDAHLTLRFAAQRTVVGDSRGARSVSIVIVEAHDGGPIFGLVVSPAGSVIGPAEAVMRAASFIEQDQLINV